MKVTVERLPESQVLLNIEIDPERVDASLDQAYKRIAPRARIPGFRPGKAPRALIERHYGRETMLHEALDKLVPTVVEEAIKAESIDIIDTPELEIFSLDPVVVKATVPVRPTVELGEYRELRIERDEVKVEPEQIEQSLEELRRRYATVEPVERPIEEGDVIRLDLKAEADGKELVNAEDAELTVREESMPGLPGLYPHLLGLEAGGGGTFEATGPEDAGEEVAGKTITYTATIRDVKGQTLPDLDDEFAKEVGESFPTLAALRERVEGDIRSRLDNEADQKLEESALDKLTEGATIEFPPQLVEREIERMLRDQGAPNDRRDFEKLLRRAGLSEEALREEFRPTASERVRRSLVLSQLREQEGISVTPEDVQAELERMSAGAQGDQVRRIFDTDTGRDAIERTLLTRRTVERLRQIVLGEAPEAGAPATTATAATPAASDAAESAAPDAVRQADASEDENPSEA